MKVVTCVSPVNIAVIKYWGKRDEDLILPINDSLSVTLSTKYMHAKTTIMTGPNIKEDRMWLNGKEVSIENPRIQRCINETRKRVLQSGKAGDPSWRVHICSENNFPTAAGLASSAAGYACLVYTLAQLYGLEGDISSIARQGSGSACRSLYGGFVRWHKGETSDGRDSIATQVAPASLWPELKIIILVVNDRQKSTSSTSGMELSVRTSELLKYRATHCVPERIENITKAVLSKDFHTFAEITMKDSNQFHATCLDTYPPIVYMNDVSHSIVKFIHDLNSCFEQNKVAYTFDAGPNACLFLLDEDVPTVLSALLEMFPTDASRTEFVKGIPVDITPWTEDLIPNLKINRQSPNLLKYMIVTEVGSGPSVVEDPKEHLLSVDGTPKLLH